MSPRIAWHLFRWVLSVASAGLLYDAFKLSFVSSGFERLLPDLVFLIKPLMVVVGISLAGTVLSISSVDLWRAWRKRTNEKKEAIRSQEAERLRRVKEEKQIADGELAIEMEQQRTTALAKLNWLISWHAKPSDVQHTTELERASIFAEDLGRTKLIHPDLVRPSASHKHLAARRHLFVVLEHLDHRGMDDARETAQNYQIPKLPANMSPEQAGRELINQLRMNS